MDSKKLSTLVLKIRNLEHQLGEKENLISSQFLQNIRTKLENSRSKLTMTKNLKELAVATKFSDAAELTEDQEKLIFSIMDLAEKVLNEKN